MAKIEFKNLILPIKKKWQPVLGLKERQLFRIYLHGLFNDVLISEWAPWPKVHDLASFDARPSFKKSNLAKVNELLHKNKSPGFLAQVFKENFSYPASFIISLALFDQLYKKPVLGKTKFLSLAHWSFSETYLAQLAKGYSCLKIKVGHDLEKELALLKLLRKLGPPSLQLRLDANKTLSLEQALSFCEKAKDLKIEFFEEPLKNQEELSTFVQKSGFSIALDETINEENAISLALKHKAKYIVIKASRFHDIFSLINLCEKIKAMSLVPIFSLCFETAFYASIMEKLVWHLKLETYSHGLASDIFEEL